jgi:hypothetical protein
MVSLLPTAAVSSPLIQKVYGACESLSRIADRVVSSASPAHVNANQGYDDGALGGIGNEAFDYSFPMGQQDWDSVMTEFEAEFGNYDSRTLTNIIEPCFANVYW